MKSFLSFIAVALVCFSVSATANAQEQSVTTPQISTQAVAQDCEDCCCDCKPVRNAVVAVLQAPRKAVCRLQCQKPVRTMACKWRQVKPVRRMFGRCCCN